MSYFNDFISLDWFRAAARATNVSLEGWSINLLDDIALSCVADDPRSVNLGRLGSVSLAVPSLDWQKWAYLHELGHVWQANQGWLGYFSYKGVPEERRFGDHRAHASKPSEADASRYAFEHPMCPWRAEDAPREGLHPGLVAHLDVYLESIRAPRFKFTIPWGYGIVSPFIGDIST